MRGSGPGPTGQANKTTWQREEPGLEPEFCARELCRVPKAQSSEHNEGAAEGCLHTDTAERAKAKFLRFAYLSLFRQVIDAGGQQVNQPPVMLTPHILALVCASDTVAWLNPELPQPSSMQSKGCYSPAQPGPPPIRVLWLLSGSSGPTGRSPQSPSIDPLPAMGLEYVSGYCSPVWHVPFHLSICHKVLQPCSAGPAPVLAHARGWGAAA